MTKPVITYRVVGRYMEGTSLIGYHLVGSDGSQALATRERAIYMVGRGLLENMRVQSNGNEMILRGKGVNLNTLPIFDQKRNKFRGNTASQDVENTAVKPKRGSGINPMGQLKIIKRMMHKTSCLGYIVLDLSGKERKLSRERVIELAIQKLISNATVQRYKAKGEGKTKLILRGAGCDLSELPAVIVDSNGNVIDPVDDKAKIRMRAAKMMRGGIIYDKIKNVKAVFKPGDYLVCGIKGVIRPVKSDEMGDRFKQDKLNSIAICDDYLENLVNYPIEIFGTTARELRPEQIKKWAVVLAVRK